MPSVVRLNINKTMARGVYKTGFIAGIDYGLEKLKLNVEKKTDVADTKN